MFYLMGRMGRVGRMDGWDGWDGPEKYPLNFFILRGYIDYVYIYLYPVTVKLSDA